MSPAGGKENIKGNDKGGDQRIFGQNLTMERCIEEWSREEFGREESSLRAEMVSQNLIVRHQQ